MPIAVFPGGFGTLDEAMKVVYLIQTGKTPPKPLVLIDDESGYWDLWFEFINKALLENFYFRLRLLHLYHYPQ